MVSPVESEKAWATVATANNGPRRGPPGCGRSTAIASDASGRTAAASKLRATTPARRKTTSAKAARFRIEVENPFKLSMPVTTQKSEAKADAYSFLIAEWMVPF
jgi:hypothetical protein